MASLEDYRRIEFARSYAWEIKCMGSSGPPKPPSRFTDWLPAVSFVPPHSMLSVMGIDISNTEFSIPTGSKSRMATLTLYDTESLDLSKWADDWLNGWCNGNGRFVRPVLDCCNSFMVRYLKGNNPGAMSRRAILKMFPIQVNHGGLDNSGGLLTFSIQMGVVGIS